MNIYRINDIKALELEVFSGLSETQLYRYYEPDIGIFIAESANVILRALEAGYEPLSMLVETDRLESEAGPVFDMIEKKKPYQPAQLKRATYDDLLNFAKKCEETYPDQVKLSRIIVEYLEEEKKYRVVQLMINEHNKAIKKDNGYVGRVIIVDSLDDKITMLTNQKFPSQFDMPITKHTNNKG